VFNREKTIADAVKSALSQKTSFPYNVIVINNHSTDHTGNILDQLVLSGHAEEGPSGQLIQIVPERTDLGIGGCWNEAVNNKACGRFAIQLDSDDLYSSPETLQHIVDAFRQQKVTMVIGSYRMCDFNLHTLPPGLIDHKEWTDDNGCNNALRINGLGAPRAFFTPVIRQIGFPNTSYGEDYAVGLAVSRRYLIGRIFDELYLCRRWGGNSDANLSVEKTNANNLYKDRLRTIEIMARERLNSSRDDSVEDPLVCFFDRQLEAWPAAAKRYQDLSHVQTRTLGADLRLQFNPARMVSTGAKIDRNTLAKRPCFLCSENRPEEQMVLPQDNGFELLVNPFPILPVHFTIPMQKHQPQRISESYPEIHRLLERYSPLMVFYNGPECGASAPDHAHLQGGTSGLLPLQVNWNQLSPTVETVDTLNDKEKTGICRHFVIPFFVIRSRSEEGDQRLFSRLYKALEALRPCGPGTSHPEPMMNIVSWKDGEDYLSVVIPRRKHRPDCYFAEGDRQVLVSPGALDMSGLIITPREGDFERLTPDQASAILQECGESQENMDRVAAQLQKGREKEA
jgi:glycosyltransferase involved in cell wall biosynthesis/ATP adenylyltransferase/5',5'''-P-1,P-4-tetraphosphate phosphorylase II